MRCTKCNREEGCGIKSPTGEWLCGWCAIPDMLQHFDVQKARIAFLEAALREFCQRVERGEIKSERTYMKFKQLLEEKV